MRRKYLGLAIAAITALGPASAFGGDREIAQEIMTQLKSNRDSGALKHFTLDMKVDHGVVLFRGSVTDPEHKKLVLAAAEGVEGITKVVDEVTIKEAKKPEAKPAKSGLAKGSESLRNMLAGGLLGKSSKAPASELAGMIEAAPAPVEVEKAAPAPEKAEAPAPTEVAALEIAPGEVQPTAAVELAAPATSTDEQVVSGVVRALGAAQRDGRLKGFGVDVKCSGGVVTLLGRAGSEQQRDQIVSITQGVPGVQAVDQMINVIGQPAPIADPQPAPAVPAQLASNRMTPVSVDPLPAMPAPQMMNSPAPAMQVGAPVSSAPVVGAPAVGAPVMGTPVQGQPVAMAYSGGVGAPRYDAPNLPNYAWPGYASYPNYAALTYPQQYSPTAWPYIGPFYPYPQVPLGWRKVSLEWDDGWWMLDFTDR